MSDGLDVTVQLLVGGSWKVLHWVLDQVGALLSMNVPLQVGIWGMVEPNEESRKLMPLW